MLLCRWALEEKGMNIIKILITILTELMNLKP